MRATAILPAICGWLVANAALRADGGDKVDALGGAAESRGFNVLNHGAAGDDRTDNTEAFSACLKAVVEAGGGRVFLPDGVYRGRMIIPGTTTSWWLPTSTVSSSSKPIMPPGSHGSAPTATLIM